MVSMKLIPRWFSISVKEERVNRCTARDILSNGKTAPRLVVAEMEKGIKGTNPCQPAGLDGSL
jgi:hypothetical protein